MKNTETVLLNQDRFTELFFWGIALLGGIFFSGIVYGLYKVSGFWMAVAFLVFMATFYFIIGFSEIRRKEKDQDRG